MGFQTMHMSASDLSNLLGSGSSWKKQILACALSHGLKTRATVKPRQTLRAFVVSYLLFLHGRGARATVLAPRPRRLGVHLFLYRFLLVITYIIAGRSNPSVPGSGACRA